MVFSSLDFGLHLSPGNIQCQSPTGELILELVEAILLFIEVLLGCSSLLEAVDLGMYSKVTKKFCSSKVSLVEE
jgi:hypothetical protein